MTSANLIATEPLPLAAQLRANRLSPLTAGTLGALALLAAGAGVFAAAAVATTPFASRDADARQSFGWRPPVLAALAPIPAPSPNADAQTLSRPPFSRTRRPELHRAVEAATRAKDDAKPPALALGAVVRYGAKRRAFVTDAQGANGEWYRVGEKVAGWTVAEIRQDLLMLQNAGRSAQLQLYPDPPPEPAEAPAVPAASVVKSPNPIPNSNRPARR